MEASKTNLSGQVWSDWVSSEDGTYFYRARKLADGKSFASLPCWTPADFLQAHGDIMNTQRVTTWEVMREGMRMGMREA
jgi:hypothetical protein